MQKKKKPQIILFIALHLFTKHQDVHSSPLTLKFFVGFFTQSIQTLQYSHTHETVVWKNYQIQRNNDGTTTPKKILRVCLGRQF